MQRLADVDIAEPGDAALVEQRGSSAASRAPASRRAEARGVEIIAERLDADVARTADARPARRLSTSSMKPNRRGSL